MSNKYSHFPYTDFPYIDDFCDDEVYVFSTIGQGPEGEKGDKGDASTDEQTYDAVSRFIEDHPEYVTTIEDGAVTTSKIANGAVTAPKLANDAIPTMSRSTKGIAKVGAGLAMNNGAVELDGNGDIATAVSSWLDAHPEATTTVQDGTVSSKKLMDDVIASIVSTEPWIKNDSVNLYSEDVAIIERGYYDEHGDFYGSTNYLSVKMPVKPSTTYTVSHNRHYMTFWDLDDAFVGYAGQASADLDDYTFTTPATAAWVILTLSVGYNRSEYMMVEGDTMPSEYTESDYRLNDGVFVPNDHEIAFVYANNSAYPAVDWSAGTISINSGLILARDSAITSLPRKTLTMEEGYGLLLVESGTWDVTIAPLTQVSQQRGQYAIGYYINVPSVQVVYIYGLGYIYSTKFVTHLMPMNVMMGASETNVRAVLDAVADTLTINASGGFSMYNYVTNSNSLPAINLTIENVSSYAALIFYQDSTTRDVKWADWQFWSTLPPSSLILGYRYGMRLFMFGRTVTYKINRGTADTASVKYASCVFGDSITAGVNSAMPYHYDDMVYGYRENKNFGVGSSGYSVNASGSVVVANGVYGAGTRTTAPARNTVRERIEQYASSIESGDAIVIAAGTNDFSSSTVTLESFESAIRECYEYVLSNFTNPLIVCTPIHRQSETNSQGETLRQYVDKIKEVCSDMGISVIDFYENVQLHPERANWRTLYIPDGLHPNQRGHRLMSWFFGSEMNKYVGDSTR